MIYFKFNLINQNIRKPNVLKLLQEFDTQRCKVYFSGSVTPVNIYSLTALEDQIS